MPELLNENSDTPNLLGIFWDITLVWLVIISLTLVRRKKVELMKLKFSLFCVILMIFSSGCLSSIEKDIFAGKILIQTFHSLNLI